MQAKHLIEKLDLLLADQSYDIESFLKIIAEYSMKLTNASASQILLFDPVKNALVIKAEVGSTTNNLDMVLPQSGKGITVCSASAKKPLVVNDIETKKWKNLYIDTLGGMRSELAIPMLSGDRLLGVLNLEAKVVNAFSRKDIDLANLLAQRASTALATAKKVDVLHGVLLAASAERELKKTLDAMCEAIVRLFSYDRVTVFGISSDKKSLNLLSQNKTLLMKWPESKPHLRIGQGYIGKAAQKKEVVAYKAELIDSEETSTSVASAFAIPLISGNKILGVLAVESKYPTAFKDMDIKLLEVFAAVLGMAITNAKFVDKIEKERQKWLANTAWTTLGEVTANLVHRISNDVGIIPVLVSELMAKHKDDPETKGILRIIGQNAKSVLLIVDELIKRTKTIEDLAIRDMDLKLVIDAALENTKIPKNVHVVTEVDKDFLEIRSTVALRDITQELLSNACMAIGSDPGSIVISTKMREKYVVLQIKNSGIPIPEDSYDRIFSLFYRTPTSRSRKTGLGFGLWWVRNVLEREGNEIRLAHSSKEKGTLFEILLRRGQIDQNK